MKKTNGEILAEKLTYTVKNFYEVMDTNDEIAMFCEEYKKFLDSCKTEREAVIYTINAARAGGFKEFEYNKKYKKGDKIYYNNRGKAVILAVIGSEPLSTGLNIAAAHIDSPRLDFKPNPLFEKNETAYFKTQYYGGIKKYQWTAIPLALHGVITKKGGENIEVVIGESDTDPVFTITDLLPHLAKEQMSKPLKDAIAGENLNILIGSLPFKDDKVSEKVKLNILNILFERYGITEKDFISAELMAVPAFKARDIGFDRGLIGSYGQDDRVCSFTALKALLDVGTVEKTALLLLADKEEVGSMGSTGTQSDFFLNFVYSLARQSGANEFETVKNSKCLSADVNAAFDPIYPDVLEDRNCAYLNYGAVLTKYTGSGGKSGTSDASAEVMRFFTDLFDDNNVLWQTGQLGKVDQGGGGTVAQFIANMDIDVVDLGVPVLSMHSPMEITSKSDIYMTYKAVLALYSSQA